MKLFPPLKVAMKATVVTSLLTASLLSINCGGGGGGDSDEENITIRPKSLDGLELTLAGPTITLEFIRFAGEQSAIRDGDTESGAVIYTANNTVQFHEETVNGDSLDAQWPESVGQITYTYRAINDSAAELLITTSTAGYIVEEGSNGDGARRVGEVIDSPINVYYFSAEPVASTTRFLLNFATNGTTITNTAITVSPTDLPTTEILDEFLLADVTGTLPLNELTFLTEGSIIVSGVGPVPVNFDVTDNELFETVSGIANSSLDQQTVFFTPDNPDINNPDEGFSLACVADTSNSGLADETGSAIFADENGDVVVGSAGYVYDRILGQDAATIVVDSTGVIDGTITLTFASPAAESQRAFGTYIINSGQATGQTGQFIIRSGGTTTPGTL